jgi:hypothetical protein
VAGVASKDEIIDGVRTECDEKQEIGGDAKRGWNNAGRKRARTGRQELDASCL